jgi:glycerol-3-phosphate dehydrogenase (NAD(P)+)
MVAEGVKNSLALSRLAIRMDIEMPITEQMRAVIYDGKSPRAALEELMARERKAENVL